MSGLILDSLEVRNFRGFRHLQIERLDRINLIVGKNNVGKSSLLEALQLYAKRADSKLIFEFLRSRDESTSFPVSNYIEFESHEDVLRSLKYLFYGRHDITRNTKPIQIGGVNSPDSILSVAIKWYVPQTDEQGVERKWLLQTKEYEDVDDALPRFTIQLGNQPPINYSLISTQSSINNYFLIDSIANRAIRTELKEINSIYAKTNFLSKVRIGELWDSIALTGLDKEVLGALRIVAPGVEGLTFVNDSRAPVRRELGLGRERIPLVKIKDIDERLPLGHLGDGMMRILGVALALANAKGGILLIDEIENGLHYSVQLDLWRLIFRLAQQLNVQVFAATHSWDCIEGFQRADQENDNVDGMLISLESSKAEVEAVLYDKDELKVVTRNRIEVR